MSEICSRLDPGKPARGRLSEDVPERLDPLRTVAVAAMLDGSTRVSDVASTINRALRDVTQAWKAAARMPDADLLELVASGLSDLTDLLGKAERELIAAARADFDVTG